MRVVHVSVLNSSSAAVVVTYSTYAPALLYPPSMPHSCEPATTVKEFASDHVPDSSITQ